MGFVTISNRNIVKPGIRLIYVEVGVRNMKDISISNNTINSSQKDARFIPAPVNLMDRASSILTSQRSQKSISRELNMQKGKTFDHTDPLS
jgi:hypothetical protein